MPTAVHLSDLSGLRSLPAAPVLRRRWLPLLLWAVATGAAGSGACAGSEGIPAGAMPSGQAVVSTPTAVRSAAAVPTPATGPAAAPEPFPWEAIDTVRTELGGALARGDWSALSGRVPPNASVMRYPSGADVQELTGVQLVAWLRARWSPAVSVGEPQFVAHFPSLETPTTGWRPVAPSGGTIHFVFHVNPDTRRWFLDVLQYE